MCMIRGPNLARGMKEGFLKDKKFKVRCEVWGGVIQVKDAEYVPGEEAACAKALG